ncbi:MAG: ATPase, T2SS/T4P/T4SS family [Bacillota bacterium]|nr:ATPase, T2SS/T4P/T4SS family [Bacillota bacterium]
MGKTTLACNLGIALASSHRRLTVIVDLNPCWGDAAALLDVEAKNGWSNLVGKRVESLTIEDLRPSLIPHSSGVYLLPPPEEEVWQALTAAQVAQILRLLQGEFEFVLVDTPCSFDERVLPALERAARVFLVLQPDLSTLYKVKRALRTMDKLHIPQGKVQLILNRAGSAMELGKTEIRASLEREIFGVVPSDGRALIASINRGLPLRSFSPHSPVLSAVDRLAKQIVAQKEINPEYTVQPLNQIEVVQEQEGLALYEKSAWLELKEKIYQKALQHLDLSELVASGQGEGADLKRAVGEHLVRVLAEIPEVQKLERRARERLLEELGQDLLGLGQLEDLLRDPEITEIMVNGAHQVFIEKRGRLVKVEQVFLNEAQVMRLIERIVAPLGRRVDEASPMVDARLPDGSRVNVIIPPLALNGPLITIRKFSAHPLTMEDLMRLGTLSPEMADFLRQSVIERRNILVTGGTGAGKTTLLNTLSAFIPPWERIITIEDAAELRLQQEHVVRLEARPPNIEGEGMVTIRDLVRNALRMRPDRIIVGEVRGGEALDMLQAMNTGHDGSLATLHANSPWDALSRLETMVLMSGLDLPVRAIRDQIGAAIHLIVHMGRGSDGRRRVLSIAKIAGGSGERPLLEEIFSWREGDRWQKVEQAG